MNHAQQADRHWNGEPFFSVRKTLDDDRLDVDVELGRAVRQALVFAIDKLTEAGMNKRAIAAGLEAFAAGQAQRVFADVHDKLVRGLRRRPGGILRAEGGAP